MKKITLTLLVLLVTCGMWQVNAQSVSISPSAAIPDNSAAGIDFTLTVTDDLSLTDVDLEFDANHTWVGDMIVTLFAPDGTSAVLIDRMGAPPGTFGCSSNDLDVTLDDAAGSAIEDQCGASSADPVPTGTFSPNNPLSIFNGVASMGVWTVNVSDNGGGDLGTVNTITLVYTGTPGGGGPPTPPGSFEAEFCYEGAPFPIDPPGVFTATLTAEDTDSPADDGTMGTGLGEYTIANVRINMEHTFASDLVFELTNDDGTVLLLSDGNGGSSGLDVAADLIFVDGGASLGSWSGLPDPAGYAPEGGSFAAFDGDDMNGDWFLTVTDTFGGDSGTLYDFCITFERNVGTAPVLECLADITADNLFGTCGAIVNFAPPVGFDIEDGFITAVPSSTPTSGDIFPVGDTVVEFTVTDLQLNETTCTFTVTIFDVDLPMAVCQPFTVTLDEFGNGSIDASDLDGGSTDNCAVDTFAASQTSFDCSDLGDNDITLTVTDVNGNNLCCCCNSNR